MWSRYSMSVLRSVCPLNVGPGFVYSVHPSGQCSPVAVGPFSTLHLRRSKLKILWTPRQFCQTTPRLSTATPPEYVNGAIDFGGVYTSALHVCGGFSPRSS